MIVKYYNNGVLQEQEDIGRCWIARICKGRKMNMTTLDLSSFAKTYKKSIKTESGTVLELVLCDAPFLESVYAVMDLYKGMRVLEFEENDDLITVEW